MSSGAEKDINMNELKKILRKILRYQSKQQAPANQTLNEAINFNKKCIFIAVPKTGTTSIRTQIKQKGAPLIKNPHLNIVQIRDALYVYLLIQALGRNKSFPSASVSSDAALRLKAKETFDGFFKFSAVRNPWARAVSLYSRREGVRSKNKLSFEKFCKNHFYASDTCYHPTLHQNQFDWLCNEHGQCMMDYVYKLENFNESIDEIAELTNGRILLKKEHANRNSNSKSHSYRDIYTEETKKLIAERFEKDIDTFKYTF